MTDRKAPLLRLSNISKGFSTAGFTERAVSDLSFSVYDGEFLAIIGPSGAGKSTLLNILGLLESYDSGNYYIDGNDVKSLSERNLDELRAETFGFVFQASHMLPHTSVDRNAALGLGAVNIEWNRRQDIALEALSSVGVSHRAYAQARTLSGGEKQRVAISRAIATNPRVILADELTGNLDSQNSESVMQILRNFNEKGTTVILITHDLKIAEKADRLLTLQDGRIVSDTGSIIKQTALSKKHPKPAKNKAQSFSLFLDPLFDAINGLTERPLRTLALLAAFVLGVAGLVSAVGLSASTAQQVSSRLAEGALDEVYVFRDSDLSSETLQTNISQISKLSHVKSVGTRVDVERGIANASLFAPESVQGQNGFAGTVLGADTSYLKQQGVNVYPEHVITHIDNFATESIAFVGSEAALELGIEEAFPGVRVWVFGKPYEVIGIIESVTRNDSLLRSIVIPIGELEGFPSTISIITEMGYPATVAEAIPLLLAPANPGEVAVSTVGDLRELRYGVAGDLGIMIAVMSFVLLLMATLSASSTMLVSVQARSGEIALRRALGFSRFRTVSIFFLEGTFLGLAGGLAGSAIGLAAVVFVCHQQSWNAVLPSWAVLIGVAAGVASGVFSSVLPALKVARVVPAEAIR